MSSLNCHMRKNFLLPCSFVLLVLFSALLCQAQNPRWIWHDNHATAIKPDEVRYFRKTFEVSGNRSRASLSVAADDEADLVHGMQDGAPAGGRAHRKVSAEVLDHDQVHQGASSGK